MPTAAIRLPAETGLKLCYRCKRLRDRAEFGTRAEKPDGLRHECRECSNEIRRAAYARNRAWLNEIKLASGCVDCGYREHSVALDFDHRPGEVKRFNLVNCGARSLAVVQAEAAKCDVRCANCHRVKTAERLVGAVA